MIMKNKPKRYTVVLEDGIEVRKLISRNQVEKIKEELIKYNDNSKNGYYFGNIQIDRNNNQIIITKYKKITLNSSLEEIDASTVNFNSEGELKKLYNIDIRNPRHLLIAYRANKEIKLLPIIFKKNKKYLNRDFLKHEFNDLGKDINFLNLVLNDKQIEYSARTSYVDFDNLYALRQKLKYEMPALVDTYPMNKFFSSFITDGGKYHYLHFRLLANLVLDFNKSIEKQEIVEENQEEIFGQMCIEEMCMKELRDLYEEMKIACTEGTLSEVYSHKLIKRREN